MLALLYSFLLHCHSISDVGLLELFKDILFFLSLQNKVKNQTKKNILMSSEILRIKCIHPHGIQKVTTPFTQLEYNSN